MIKQLKAFLICFFLILSTSKLFASSCDSIVYESENVQLLFCKEGKDYTWIDKNSNKKLKHLKFARKLGHEFQILDRENNLFYIDENGKRSDESEFRRFVCGTVPHFILKVATTDSTFEVYEDETRYDSGNRVPEALQRVIAKEEADSVFFINGLKEFAFTSNFGYMSFLQVDPWMVLLSKDGQVFALDNPEETYDAIAYSFDKQLLLTQKDGLYGILDLVEPKYAEISGFEFYLAKVQLPNGEVTYIDVEGREY